jgi:16S rRNA (guanine(966)-N(2))-methyltransferase RsmD
LSAAQNKVRIGGGEWRSRILHFPDALGLRPTPDRVRETLFNWLGQEMHGRVCLDLFSGSGAIGFEALSRGAARMIMVENNSAVHRTLLQNASVLEAKNLQILRVDAIQFLAQNTQLFDVIFLDPPFGQHWLEKLMPLLARHLAADGVVYAEAEKSLDEQGGWKILKRGKAGNVYYHLLKYAHEPES